jgi:hypothetical protein
LEKPLLDLADAQYEREQGEKKKRQPHPTLGAPAAEANGQLKMFPLTTEQRQEFLDFAENISFYLKEDKHPFEFHDEEYWKKYHKMEFSGYEFYAFWAQFKEADLRAGIALLEQVGRGEPLDDYLPVIRFLGSIVSHAHWAHGNARGGCF